ncbi:hypothetical protein [Chamaesiphon sp.]|uniref:hypothetical protein n=1 Tax=Chamaesiphon sp. TaxID=2814140 RepID=UPI003593FC05
MKPLTNSRRSIFLEVANAKEGITKSKLCQHSVYRGGSINRIPHHLVGLQEEGYIKVTRSCRKEYLFNISKKGARMLAILQP